jgi:hypothetical protein
MPAGFMVRVDKANVASVALILAVMIGAVQVQAEPSPILRLNDHRQPVVALALSPVGDVLASGGFDWDIRLWKVPKFTQSRKLSGHTSWSKALVYSPDGRLLVSGSSGGRIGIWDAVTGRETRTLRPHSDIVNSVAFSADGSLLLSGSQDNTACISTVESGRQLILRGHTRPIRSVVFPRQGGWVITAGDDGSIRTWSVRRGRQLHPISIENEEVLSIAISIDNSLLASASWVGSTQRAVVRIWDTDMGKPIFTDSIGSHHATVVAFSPDNKLLVAGCLDGTLHTWDVSQLKRLASPKLHKDAINAVVFLASGHRIATAGWDQTVAVWDTAQLTTPTPVRLNDKQNIADVFSRLGDVDVQKAHVAVFDLVSLGDGAVTYMDGKLGPEAPGGDILLSRLLEQFKSDDAPTRDRAAREIVSKSPLYRQLLYALHEKETSNEVRVRLDAAIDLCERPVGLDSATMRSLRAIVALEQIGTPPAIGVLQRLARNEQSLVGERARGALVRLKRSAASSTP